jgi:hypothetical protein
MRAAAGGARLLLKPRSPVQPESRLRVKTAAAPEEEKRVEPLSTEQRAAAAALGRSSR